ncbi:hypothetical protein K443DRAFT_116288, partial [Laccaria amethystina LaAM-08-1]
IMRERCHESGHVVNVPNAGRERDVPEIKGKPGAEIHVGIVVVLNVREGIVGTGRGSVLIVNR